MCVLEAMSLGVPIVSTPVDGVMDLIENGKNGYLSNDCYDLAEKLIYLTTHSKEQKIFSERAKEKLNSVNSLFNYKNTLNRYYKEITSK